jgi:hypothetical protein
MPELAAGGLWSTPTDLAKLLIEIARAYLGEKSPLIGQKTAIDMLDGALVQKTASRFACRLPGPPSELKFNAPIDPWNRARGPIWC